MTPPKMWDSVAILRRCRVCFQWRQISKFDKLDHICKSCIKVGYHAGQPRQSTAQGGIQSGVTKRPPGAVNTQGPLPPPEVTDGDAD